MTGVELRRGEDVLFRGGVLDMGGYFWLCNEDGSLKDKEISIVTTNGSVMYVNGKAVDPAEPSVSTILDLMSEPELTHKGNWGVWFCAVFICVLNALSILFADELFHFNLMFLIRDAEYAEPSDWEMAGRYAGWIGLPIVALIILVIGLQ